MDINVYIHGGDEPSPIERKLEEIMADLAALNTAVTSLVDAEHAAADELEKLAGEVAGLTAGAVSQEQIDSIAASVTGVAEKLQADVAGAEPSAPPVV
jgi:ABC-type transporter Mla subunit MlaD